MLGPTEWLDSMLHPRLVLDGERVEVVYQPVAMDHGSGPPLATFKVQCNVRHHAGSLTYTADDLTMMPLAFAEFADNLKLVLDGGAQEATLAPVGLELAVTVKRVDDRIQLMIAVTEWQGPYDADTIASAGCGRLNLDRAYRWVRELTEYARVMDEWVLTHPSI
jgi:hypothetical protein